MNPQNNHSALPLRHIALLLRYDGTAYHGWQRQKGQTSVCQTVQDAIAKTVGHPVTLHGCGRTDAGVHALHYVAGFSAHTRIPAERLPYAMEIHLPGDITVLQAADVPESFSAIGSCVRKEYTYRLYTGDRPDPFLRQTALFFPQELDLELMRKCAGTYVGTHDFAALRSLGSTPVKSTVRTVYESKLTVRGRHVFFTVSANGFLYNMVRTMTGTLLYIGLQKLSPDALPELLSGAGSRAEAGPTAPPHGLYMTGVWYGGLLPWESCSDFQIDN